MTLINYLSEHLVRVARLVMKRLDLVNQICIIKFALIESENIMYIKLYVVTLTADFFFFL